MTEDEITPIRIRMGLSVPLMAQLIRATSAEIEMIAGRATPTKPLMRRVNDLHTKYSLWRDDALQTITHLNEVTPRRLTYLLHLSMWSVQRMIRHGELVSRVEWRQADGLGRSIARHWIGESTIREAFVRNETELKDVTDERRLGIFGRAFANYVEDSEGIRRAS